MSVLLRFTVVMFLITFTPFTPLRAQAGADTAVPEIDPSLTKVVVAGYWEAGAMRGSYRVVEISEGSEEIRRHVVVQWLSDPSEEEARVVASRALGPLAGNVWSVSDPELVLVKGRWYVTVRTTSRSMGQPDGRLRVALGVPGKFGPVSRR